MLSLARWLSSKPVDPVVVFVLNLFGAGGAGYWLIGQREKAIVAMLLFIALAWPTCFAGSFLVSGVAAVDGYLQARRAGGGGSIGKWTFFS